VYMFEFKANAAGNYNVTRGTLRKLHFMPVTTTSGYPLWNAVRLNSVEIWAASLQSSGLNTFSVVSLEWVNPNAFSSIKTDAGNVNRPAHLRSSPPRNSIASMPGDATLDSQLLFQMNLNQGDIVQISITVTEANTTLNPVSGTSGVVGELTVNLLGNNNLVPTYVANSAAILWT